MPTAISVSNCPISPELNALAASRLASSASAPEVGATASARATPASTPIERSITCAAGSTPSAYQTVPFTRATMATCAQPPTSRVHCISSVGLPPRIVVATGGSQRNRLSMPLRHWTGGGELAQVAPAVPGTARADPRTRLLPGAAEHVGALPGLGLLRAVLAHRVLADRDLRDRLGGDCLVRRAHRRPAGGVSQPNSSSGTSSDNRRSASGCAHGQ